MIPPLAYRLYCLDFQPAIFDHASWRARKERIDTFMALDQVLKSTLNENHDRNHGDTRKMPESRPERLFRITAAAGIASPGNSVFERRRVSARPRVVGPSWLLHFPDRCAPRGRSREGVLTA